MLREQPNYGVVAAEIWSIGMIILECLLGAHPFSGLRSKRELQANQLMVAELYENMSYNQRTLLDGMLAHDPRKRFTIRELRDKLEELYPTTPAPVHRSSSERTYSISRARTFDSIYDYFSSPDPSVNFARNPFARSSSSSNSPTGSSASETRSPSRGR